MQQGVSGTAPARLTARGLRKSYGALVAVSGVSLEIAPGEVHGLCGPNGAGKSTIVKMLSGQVSPDEGTIAVDGDEVVLSSPQQAQRAGIAIVDQELSIVPALSVRDNLALGAGGRRGGADDRRLLDEVGLEHVDPSTPAHRLTLGERQLVEIARALGRDARLLILDEPTATLSDHEIARVFDAVRRATARGHAVVFVSHRLGEVLDLCDRVTVVRDGGLVATTRTAVLDMDELIGQMVGSTVDLSGGARRRAAGAVGGARTRLTVQGLRVGRVVHDFSLEAEEGRIYALAGQLGAGAGTVARALGGLEARASGRIEVDGHRIAPASPTAAARGGIAFVSADRKAEGLFLTKSVATNLGATRLSHLSRAGVVRGETERSTVRDLAARAGVRADRVDDPVGDLSGGNQQKVLVGRALDHPDVKVLVLDEPTRGVDVAGRAVIHDLLRAAADDGLTVVFASTDLDELVGLGDVVVTMWGGRQVGRHEAGVDPAVVLADVTHRREVAA
jgi:ABC-type sugar transport system ATPase subunit